MNELPIRGDSSSKQRHLALLAEVRKMHGVVSASLAGSRMISGGYDESSDYDIVVHASGTFTPGGEWSMHEDYKSAAINSEVQFTTYRRGEDNLIVYKEHMPYAVFRNLALLAANYGITEKSTRVGMFADVLRGTRECVDVFDL